jgi:hypothetical protein
MYFISYIDINYMPYFKIMQSVFTSLFIYFLDFNVARSIIFHIFFIEMLISSY